MTSKELEKLSQREIKEYLEKLPEKEAINILKSFSMEFFNSIELEVGFVTWAASLIKKNKNEQNH